MIHSRIGALSNLRLPRFGPYLKKLCLRQNVITYLDPEIMDELVELEELDLYDNKVKTLGDSLKKLKKLKYVLTICFAWCCMLND